MLAAPFLRYLHSNSVPCFLCFFILGILAEQGLAQTSILPGEISATAASEVQGILPLLPGVSSSIKKVFVVGHEHMDIGFDAPPETMKGWCKAHIDTQIAYARTRPDFKWNIEDTWDF